MRSLKKIIKSGTDNNFIENNLNHINTINNPNHIAININSSLVINDLPISPIGLSNGSVWVDGDGFLRMVQIN